MENTRSRYYDPVKEPENAALEDGLWQAVKDELNGRPNNFDNLCKAWYFARMKSRGQPASDASYYAFLVFIYKNEPECVGCCWPRKLRPFLHWQGSHHNFRPFLDY